ncbi:hypothetical protein [Streptomyces sp. 6N106]|uniref:hypothetical protein n=1 Tax=Streptomyces sp. 6N106 TaxID=3457418 RepID=UPI003FD047FC
MRPSHLLAWELAQLPAGKKVTPVVLLDTFEDTGDRHRDAERLLQRLVWLMPNCFFVISGRNRLQWADDALQGQLDYTGRAAWPGLALHSGRPARATGQGGARQHLIGDFSETDCDTYLAHRLTQGNQPLIGPDIRAVITQRSHGLPLHLDLAVARFLEIRRTGRTPTPADFDHTIPALIARTLSDLTADERHVLRSASLLDAFDLGLATQAAGLAHQAAARRLVERPLITEDPHAIWPYHLHDAIRTALRADDHTEDHWTPADWHQAAERALAALGRQWQDTSTLLPSRTLLIAGLRQSLRLARDHHLGDLGWLTPTRALRRKRHHPVEPHLRLSGGTGNTTGLGYDAGRFLDAFFAAAFFPLALVFFAAVFFAAFFFGAARCPLISCTSASSPVSSPRLFLAARTLSWRAAMRSTTLPLGSAGASISGGSAPSALARMIVSSASRYWSLYWAMSTSPMASISVTASSTSASEILTCCGAIPSVLRISAGVGGLGGGDPAERAAADPERPWSLTG